MRNRSKTIEALRRLAERPGTPEEGETARALLERLGGGRKWKPRPFDAAMFPQGTRIFYCYWCYRNYPGVVRTKPPKVIDGQWWMLIKFDRLKAPRWVPVTSELGCHIGLVPFEGLEEETLYHRDAWYWEQSKMFEQKFADFLKERGVELPKAFVENAPRI